MTNFIFTASIRTEAEFLEKLRLMRKYQSTKKSGKCFTTDHIVEKVEAQIDEFVLLNSQVKSPQPLPINFEEERKVYHGSAKGETMEEYYNEAFNG